MLLASPLARTAFWVRLFLLLLSLPVAPAFLIEAQQYSISTAAGGAPPANGISGPFAAVGNTNGVIVDASGNVFFSSSLGCVFKIDSSGLLTRVAGTGLDSGTIADGGQALTAKLLSPMGLAFDSAGSLYIADSADNRVRRVASNGVITTVAGVGSDGYSGDGALASLAQLSRPSDVALDSAGNLYIADSGNDVVRKVSTAGIITTVAGDGFSGYYGDGGSALVAALSTPFGVRIDGSGNLLIADQGNHCIRKVSTSGMITTIAGTSASGFSGDGSAAINATLSSPQGIALDASGALFIADTGNRRVRKVGANGNISTIAGNGNARYPGDGALAATVGLVPVAVAVDSTGKIAVADQTNNGVRQVLTTGYITTLAGNGLFDFSGDGGPATGARLEVTALAVNSGGSLYVADDLNNNVRSVTAGGTIETYAGQRYGVLPTVGAEAADVTLTPQAIGVDASGNVYVNNGGDTLEATPGGSVTSYLLRDNLQGVDAAGNVYTYNDNAGPIIQRITPAQAVTTMAGGGNDYFDCGNSPEAANNIQLGFINAVAVSPTGDVYYSQLDFYTGEPNYCVFRVASGTVSVVAGDGQPAYGGDGFSATAAEMLAVNALAVDAQGRLYIADSSRVRMVSNNGIINTIAGNGIAGSAGDGGSAINAQVAPSSLAAGVNGNVYIGQQFAVRLLTPPAPANVATILSPNANGVYGSGSSLTIQMTFNEPVTVSGLPLLSLNSGGTATYSSGSGTTTLTFSYVVASGQSASQLDCASANALNLNGGSVRDALGTMAALVLPALGATGSLSMSRSLVINTAAPSFTISGQITSGGQPLVGVSVSLNNGVSTSTNSSGAFSLAGLASGATYTVTPSFSGFSFTPNTRTISSINANQTVNFAAAANSSAVTFVPITPCRVVDTRRQNSPFGGPFFGAGATRQFSLPAGTCGIPGSATAYSLNVTAVPSGPLNFLTIWPSGQVRPIASTLNSDGRIKANGAIVLAGTSGGVSVFVSDPSQVILDINGYFVAAGSPGALAFYPLPPCRVADTRGQTGPLGAPALVGGFNRTFPVLASSCNVPSSVQAYSFNITALPKGTLGFLTAWPAGQAQPLASTLNANTGQVTANAAIVPAGSDGAISVYATDDTDLLLDIDGYFAPPLPGGLALYPVVPCRAVDTRNPAGAPALQGTTQVTISAGSCASSSQAQAYVLNATVVPTSPLGWLTLWPIGLTRPKASTLNAYDGAVTSNMAIIPTSNGLIDAFVSGPTYLILDLAAYFAP